MEDDPLQDAGEEVIDAAESVIETELDKIMLYGALAAIAIFAVAFAMGWIGKAAKGAGKK